MIFAAFDRLRMQSLPSARAAIPMLMTLLLLRTSPCAAQTEEIDDKVVFSFATVGDSRGDANEADATPQDKLWQQNTRALSRILREIQAQKPNAFFFNGDMIMGYSTKRSLLNPQYAYWRGMVSALLETGTYVVPIPGNHEVQIKVPRPDGDVDKVAQPESETVWRENMGDLIVDTNLWLRLIGRPVSFWDINDHPKIGGTDGVLSDQSQLTYSFDCGDMHFCILNTDAVGQDSHAPTAWLKGDLESAEKRGARHFFIFGHKMAFTYQYGKKHKEKGLDSFTKNRDRFWNLVETYHATYFCGHEHIYNVMQPLQEGRAHHSWQILVGSGGSPFEAKPGESTKPNDRTYAWALVRVHQSGKVTLESRGFDEYYHATTTLDCIQLNPPFNKN